MNPTACAMTWRWIAVLELAMALCLFVVYLDVAVQLANRADRPYDATQP